MRSRTKQATENEDLDVFPSFTDLMSNAFMIMSFFLLLVLFQLIEFKSLTGEDIDTIVEKMQRYKQENIQLKKENEVLNQEKKKLKKEIKNKYNATPIIIDEKSGNFKFQSGSAELKPEFKQYINLQITPQISKIIQEMNIDFIQVIGHTDGQVIESTGNLDKTLEKAAQNQVNVANLKAGSNADLGLMRALAVVQELSKQKELKNVKFRAYSAAQLYLPSGELAPLNRQADKARRRIEIRFIPPAKTNIGDLQKRK